MVALETDELHRSSLKCNMCSREFIRDAEGKLHLNSIGAGSFDSETVHQQDKVGECKEESANDIAPSATPDASQGIQMKSVKEETPAVAPAKQKQGKKKRLVRHEGGRKSRKLSNEQIDDILKRLAKGEKPVDIAPHIPCDMTTVYNYKNECKEKILELQQKNAKIETVKHFLRGSPQYGGQKARAVQCMKQVRAGKMAPEAALKVLLTYRPFLHEDVGILEKQLKSKKKELQHVDDAIKQITDITQGWQDMCKKI